MKKIRSIFLNTKRTFGNVLYIFRITNQASPMFFWLQIPYVITGVVAPIIASLFTKYLLNELAGSMHLKKLLFWASCIVLSTAGIALIRKLIEAKISMCELFVNHQIDSMICEKTTSMDYSYIENKEIQENITLAKNGLRNMGGVLTYVKNFSDIVQAILTITSIAVIFFNINIIVPLLIVVVQLLGIYFKKKQNESSFKFNNENDRLNLIYSYTWFLSHDERAARDSRVYDLKPLYRKKIGNFLEESYRINRAASRTDFFYTFIQSFCRHTYMLVAYLLFALQAILSPETFTIGDLSMAISLARQFDSAVEGIIQGCLQSVYNGKYIELFRDFLDMPNQMARNDTEALPNSNHSYNFIFENVSFKYPGCDEYALRHVNCEIKAGQKTALVGENGSGKSTFIKLLCRLYDPTEGRILLNGKDIKMYSYEEYLDIFSVVFQDYDVVPFSVRENVNISSNPEKQDSKVWDALSKVGMKDAIASLSKQDLTYVLSKFNSEGINFSGGEKQKLAIARALYKNAPVMILDEPTAALDPRSEYEIYQMFRNNVKDKTAILISHRLSSCRMCDNILVFQNGELIQMGNHNSLLKTGGLYAELWKAQAENYVFETT